MGKLNRSVVEAKEFIEQNKGTMTNKQMGIELGGVSAARISQLKDKPAIADGVAETSEPVTA